MIQVVGNLFMLFTFAECLLFVLFYGFGSPWRVSPIGRAVMNLAGSMALILGYAFVARWVVPPEDVRQYIALAVYIVLALVWGRMLLLLRYAQQGHITPENPNYQPLRNWWNGHIAKRSRKV